MHECQIAVGVDANAKRSVVEVASNFARAGESISKKATFSSYTVSRIGNHDGHGEITNVVFEEEGNPLSLRLTSSSSNSKVSIAYKYNFYHKGRIDPREVNRHPVYVVVNINDKHNILKGLIRELIILRRNGAKSENVKVRDDVRFSSVESVNVFEV